MRALKDALFGRCEIFFGKLFAGFASLVIFLIDGGLVDVADVFGIGFAVGRIFALPIGLALVFFHG
jgi:hypothetical protein